MSALLRRRLPPYARLQRGLEVGLHRYLDLLPDAAQSPAFARIETERYPRGLLLDTTLVRIEPGEGYAWVDIDVPCIVLMESYYRRGSALDLYLDLLHELTHIRQFHEGHNLWDRRFAYVDRITEIEGYAVAVEEGRRLGMTDEDVVRHLSNPWMTTEDVERLVNHIHDFLNGARPQIAG